MTMRLPQIALLLVVGLGACEPTTQSEPPVTMEFPATNRPDVRGTQGAVSSGHPLATAVGLDVLRRGGNATDAVVAMAGVLAVVRPNMNGVGGDAFGIFYDGESGEITGLNGSGRSGTKATPAYFAQAGHTTVPETGALSVSVPGAVSAWAEALDRHGTLGLDELLQPAIRYAEEGFPVSWRLAADFEAQGSALNEWGQALYLPNGAPPPIGSLLRNEALGATLRTIAREGASPLYDGAIARRLAAFVDSLGGTLAPEDFQRHTSTWVPTLSDAYLGHQLHVLPPNTQGMAQLAYTGMAKHHDLMEMGHNTSSYLHTLIELKKLAFADRDAWATDPDFASIPLDELLDPAYLESRAGDFSATSAQSGVLAGISNGITDSDDGEQPDDSGDTVYLTAVDQWGNAVSWIQSLFHGFGSGLLEPETGIVLHNRGSLYTLEAGHPNVVAPGKRPYHTLTPLLATRPDGAFAFTLGTPGGDSQTQSLLQIMNNMTLFGMSPQAAIEAPRFRGYEGLRVDLEDRVPADVVEALRSMGHDIQIINGWTATFGGAQMIMYDPTHGTLVAAADPRREAYALAY